MSRPSFTKAKKISLSTYPEFNERWVQNIIAEDPTILGLGDLILKDKERTQPKAGRLDLLFREEETNRRYEVELQLGKTDESHIIRTIEYWDIERKRYPQYDHCAVIIAEDVTSRFLNVIGLFNGFIPFIAIQMEALLINDLITLNFTTVIDELLLGLDEDDVDVSPADRAYWKSKATEKTVEIADELLSWINTFAEGFSLNYNKHYIGLTVDGRPNNFVSFRPRKNALNLHIKLKRTEEVDSRLEEMGLDVLDCDKHKFYRVRLTGDGIERNKEGLIDLMKLAFEERG